MKRRHNCYLRYGPPGVAFCDPIIAILGFGQTNSSSLFRTRETPHCCLRCGVHPGFQTLPLARCSTASRTAGAPCGGWEDIASSNVPQQQALTRTVEDSKHAYLPCMQSKQTGTSPVPAAEAGSLVGLSLVLANAVNAKLLRSQNIERAATANEARKGPMIHTGFQSIAGWGENETSTVSRDCCVHVSPFLRGSRVGGVPRRRVGPAWFYRFGRACVFQRIARLQQHLSVFASKHSTCLCCCATVLVASGSWKSQRWPWIWWKKVRGRSRISSTDRQTRT